MGNDDASYRSERERLDRLRLKVVSFYGGIVYPIFAGLDAAVYPALWTDFALIRVGVSAISFAAFLGSLTPLPYWSVRAFGVAISTSAALGVVAMCAATEGFGSIYLVGIIVVFMAVMTIELHRPWELAAVFSTVVGVYMAVNARLHPDAAMRDIVSAAFFLSASTLFSVIGALLLELQRKRLFEARERVAAKNAELEQAYRYQAEFFRNVSHDLRSPIHSIRGFAELIARRENDLSPRGRNYLDKISESAGRLLRRINDVLDLTKLEAGRVEIGAAPFDAAAVVEDVAEATRALVHERTIEVCVRTVGDLSMVSDEGRVRQVLENLAGNAAKFTEKGRITLSAIREGSSVLFSVEDTGVGIPSDLQEQVFAAFRQVGQLGRSQGTGLGLSIVARLIELLDGSIEMTSEVGEGTVVRARVADRRQPKEVDARNEPQREAGSGAAS